MTPDDVLAQYRVAMTQVGESVSVRRYSGSGAARTKVDTATTARVMGYRPNELVGQVVQGDMKVIAMVDTLSAILPVTVSDFLVIRGAERKIKAVDDNTRRIQGTLIALEITAAGG